MALWTAPAQINFHTVCIWLD